MNQDGEIVIHRNIRTNPEVFLKTIAPYREDIVVAVECIFTWYWLADLCAQEAFLAVLKYNFLMGRFYLLPFLSFFGLPFGLTTSSIP